MTAGRLAQPEKKDADADRIRQGVAQRAKAAVRVGAATAPTMQQALNNGRPRVIDARRLRQ